MTTAPPNVASGQPIASSWGNNVTNFLKELETTPLLQFGFWNGNTDGNAYARINWPIAMPDVPAGGDNGNISHAGVTCMSARGAGGVINVSVGLFALGALNTNNGLIRVFQVYQGNAVAYVGYCVFHFLAWSRRYSNQPYAGIDTN